MNAVYDVNLPIETLFDQIEDVIDYTDTGSHSKKPEEIAMKGQHLLMEIDIFIDNLKLWKRLPPPDRTWTHFKTDFSLAHQELHENTVVGQGLFGQANIVRNDPEIAEAMENFATTAETDRTTVTTLSSTTDRLSAELD